MMKRGYTLLFAVLVASILLAMGISIVFISRKEAIITGAARESQYAFYAANAGLECAMFQDFFKDEFATTTPPWPTTTFNCNNQVVTAEGTTFADSGTSIWQGTKYRYEFYMGIATTSDTQGSCAFVRVEKYKQRASGEMITMIEGRGYNEGYTKQGGTVNCSGRSPEKVERGIKVGY